MHILIGVETSAAVNFKVTFALFVSKALSAVPLLITKDVPEGGSESLMRLTAFVVPFSALS